MVKNEKKLWKNIRSTEDIKKQRVAGFINRSENFTEFKDFPSLVNAIIVVMFDGKEKLVEKTGTVVDGYKFSVKKKDGKKFTVYVDMKKDIIQRQGQLLYFDNQNNTHPLPAEKEVVRLMETQDGRYLEVKEEVTAQKGTYSYTNKDTKATEDRTVLLMSTDVYLAYKTENPNTGVAEYWDLHAISRKR